MVGWLVLAFELGLWRWSRVEWSGNAFDRDAGTKLRFQFGIHRTAEKMSFFAVALALN